MWRVCVWSKVVDWIWSLVSRMKGDGVTSTKHMNDGGPDANYGLGHVASGQHAALCALCSVQLAPNAPASELDRSRTRCSSGWPFLRNVRRRETLQGCRTAKVGWIIKHDR